MPYDDEDDLDISIRRRGPVLDIPNYLTQAILVTVCCCLPLGIVSIVQAARVNGLIAQGDYDAAQRASQSAKMWCIIAFVAGLVSNVVVLALKMSGDAHRGF
jgi:hypothetical protein